MDPRLIIILTSFVCSLGLGLGIQYNPHAEIRDDIVRVNATVCARGMHQFQLPGNIRVSVCNRLVDIRQFTGITPTIKGIELRRSSFISLTRIWPNITRAAAA